MAGLLQTGTLVNGQWTTTNVDINTVLERHRERTQDQSQPEPEKPPIFGLLTQTVVDSPIIRWILNARIRSSDNHDLAFIGDHTVQIRQFGREGQLHEIARKAGFGSRIRNVGVIDWCADEHKMTGDLILDLHVKKDSPDISMIEDYMTKLLPPQILVLALESGHLEFLFAINSETDVEFFTSRHRVARVMLSGEPGTHLVVDPSSRCLAIGSNDVIGIYTLHSKEAIAMQYAHGESLCLISSERYIPVEGVILHMKFLFPSPYDPDHMVLLLLVVKKGSTSMLVYEWEAGKNLSTMRFNNVDGHKLHHRYRMPLLVIPLTIKSTFLLVFPHMITECTNILLGPPDYLDVPIKKNVESGYHVGLDIPLWTAWTRPSRSQNYQTTYDCIYLAREDGVILFVEMGDRDSGGYIKGQMAASTLDCCVGTAFASLVLPDHDSDFLVTAGDSCNGGVYLVAARSHLVRTDSITNWSPMIDFVTTARTRLEVQLSDEALEPSKRRRLAVDEPDKIYACTGRDLHGAVSEMRYGYEARIRFDVPGLDFTARETWILPVILENSEDLPSSLSSPSLLFLMSAGGGSVLLHIAGDSIDIEEIDQTRTWLDLDSRTLAAATCNGFYVQITERCVVASICAPYDETTAPAIYYEEESNGKVIVAAGLHEAKFAVIVSQDQDYNLLVSGLHIFCVPGIACDSQNVSLGSRTAIEPLRGSFPLNGYPNSLSIIQQNDGNLYAIVCTGGLDGNQGFGSPKKPNLSLQLAIFKIENEGVLIEVEPQTPEWPLFDCELPDTLLEACVDIVNLRGIQGDPSQPELVLTGYRSGLLTMRQYEKSQQGGIHESRVSRYPMGSTPVSFKVDPVAPNIAFVCCDSKLWKVTYDPFSHADPVLHRFWFTAAEEQLHDQPSVDTVSILPHRLLLTSGKRLLVATLDSEPKPIPRSMLVHGTPNRILYSHRLSKLIVAVTSNGKSTLAFLDPESGKLFNRHYDSAHQKCRFPPGLGNVGERILSLVDWNLASVDVESDLLLVGTSQGSLLIYMVQILDSSNSKLGKDGLRWMPYTSERYDSPVSAIATCKSTLVICVGHAVRWVSLDKVDRELVTRAEYTLPSRGVSVTVDGHWISVLTVKHSLIKLLLVDKRQHPNLSDHHGKLFPQFGDEPPRDGLDQISLLIDPSGSDGNDSALVMIADKDCSVTGLWGTKRARSAALDYEIIFEAEMPSSVLKFRAGQVRPPWDKICSHGGLTIPSHPSGEVLGIAVDGSMTHFTLLTEQVWRLLKFLQDLDCSPRDLSSTIPNPYQDPRTKHIDGENLRSLLDRSTLQELLVSGEKVWEAQPLDWHIEEFCMLFRGLHNEESAQSTEIDLKDCLEGTYRLLSDLLRPVL